MKTLKKSESSESNETDKKYEQLKKLTLPNPMNKSCPLSDKEKPTMKEIDEIAKTNE